MLRPIPTAVAAFASVLLSGCAMGTIGTAERASQGAMRDATMRMDQARRPMPAARVSPVQVSDGIWTTGSARRSDHGEPLPRRWERDGGFTIKRATLIQLFEVGTEVTNITGMPVVFAPDVSEGQGATGAAQPQPQQPQARQPDLNAMLGSMGLSGQGGSPFGAPGMPYAGGNTAGAQGGYIRPLTATRNAMRADFSGHLSQFLNQVGAHFNVAWEYSGGEIRFFRSVTRTYTVHALPSTIDLRSTLTADSTAGSQGGGTSGGAGGGSNQRVNSSVSVEIWKDISNGVTSIVGSTGRVTTAVSTGTLTVTAPPQIISRVQAYLDGQNERLNKQISVSVQVLNVAITDSDNYGFDLTAALRDGARFGFSLASPVTAAASAGAGALGIKVVNPNANFGGTSAIVNALSEAGRVTVRTTASVTTLNGVPAPLQVANTRGYVKDVSVSDGTTSAGNTSTTRTQLTTAMVTTGFSLSLLPRVAANSDGTLLQFGINISDLNGANNGFDNFTTPDGTETVQLPNINSRNFVQQAYVPNGSTLVLAGFEQANNTANQAGVGHPSFLGLGGSQVGRNSRNVIVILMTPTVLSNEAPLITAD